MANIWEQPRKPNNCPNRDQIDCGLGIAIRKFNTIENLLSKILDESGELNEGNSRETVSTWAESNNTFSSKLGRYSALNILGKAKCQTLDEIRMHRNYLVHNYGEISDADAFNRLWDLLKKSDSAIEFLNHILENVDAKVRKANRKNEYSATELIDNCMAKCVADDDGYVLLSELGNAMRAEGLEYKGKLSSLCESLGYQLDYSPYNQNDPYGPSIVYVKKKRNKETFSSSE